MFVHPVYPHVHTLLLQHFVKLYCIYFIKKLQEMQGVFQFLQKSRITLQLTAGCNKNLGFSAVFARCEWCMPPAAAESSCWAPGETEKEKNPLKIRVDNVPHGRQRRWRQGRPRVAVVDEAVLAVQLSPVDFKDHPLRLISARNERNRPNWAYTPPRKPFAAPQWPFSTG